MFHLLAFNGSIALNAVYAQVPGVTDQVIPKAPSNDFLMPFRGRVIAAHCIGASTVKAQIQAPSMRQIAYPELWPLNITARTAIPDMNRWQTYGNDGPQFLQNEALGIYASEGGVLASPTSAALWITDGWESAPSGQTITAAADATITTVDGSWVPGNLTFTTNLPVGRFAVTGMDVVGDNSIYARLAVPGDNYMRPGVPVADVNTDVGWKDSFRFGRMGKFCEFTYTAPPIMEVFGAAAAATPFRVLLDLIKIG